MSFTKPPTAVTPEGVFIWPRLNQPDTKYVSEGVYEVKLAFEGDVDLSTLKAGVQKQLDAKFDEIVGKLNEEGKGGLAKKVTKRDIDDIFKPEEDEATGDETGRTIIKAKMKASGIRKKDGKPWSRKPDIFDARGNKIKSPPAIGGGTVGKLSVELAPYYAANDKQVGVSLRLNGVQIIKLVSFGERNAAEHGFGEEEGDDLSNYNEEIQSDMGGADTEDDDL